MTTPETYRKYADLKAQIKELTAEANELSTAIVEDIEANGGETVVTNLGSFYIKRDKKWTYSPNVEELKDKLENMKDQEEKMGLATAEETTSLTFRPKKLSTT